MLGRLVDANRLNVQLLAAVPALVLLAAGSRLAVFALYSLRARALGRQTPRSARAAHAHGHDLLLRMERCILLAPAAAAAPEPLAGRAHATGAPSTADEVVTPTEGKPAGRRFVTRWPTFQRVAAPADSDRVRLPPEAGGAPADTAAPASSAAADSFRAPSAVAAPMGVLEGSQLGEFALLLHTYLLLLDVCSPPFSRQACELIHAEAQDLLRDNLSTVQQAALLRALGTRHADLLRSLSWS